MSDEPRETLDTERMLLDFVSGRDVECPLCGYNLRDLTKPTCPECEHGLEMRVGVQRLKLIPFVLAITPGIFGGMCAAFLAAVFLFNFIANGGKFVGVPWPFVVGDVLGWLSGLFTLGLIARRHRFLRASSPKQRTMAVVIWGANVGAILMLILINVVFG